MPGAVTAPWATLTVPGILRLYQEPDKLIDTSSARRADRHCVARAP
jgi:hypothetical protein